MAVGQVVYVNMYQCAGSLGAWAPYNVAWVFADGNAILVNEPNIHVYTGKLLVGYNLRRMTDTYADPLPGPTA